MRNIHFTPAPTSDDTAQPSQEAQPCPSQEHSLPRQRQKTNDPLTEYAARPGHVERLPDSVAALILCHTGRSIVDRHQIKVTLNNVPYYFASAESATLACKNGTGEKVLWVMNRDTRDCLHLLTDDGAYIETIPLKGEARWFDTGAESKRALADARASIARDRAHMEDLHKIDTSKAVEDAEHRRRAAHPQTRVLTRFLYANLCHSRFLGSICANRRP